MIYSICQTRSFQTQKAHTKYLLCLTLWSCLGCIESAKYTLFRHWQTDRQTGIIVCAKNIHILCSQCLLGSLFFVVTVSRSVFYCPSQLVVTGINHCRGAHSRQTIGQTKLPISVLFFLRSSCCCSFYSQPFLSLPLSVIIIVG